ncbi:MAG TPA: class I adenylate-forming enzyme family protein [Aliidongia sp.]|nr:class I adenylate-forming enzyme family protein [Aliidongia sp.]
MPADSRDRTTDRLTSLIWSEGKHDRARVALISGGEIWTRARLFGLAEQMIRAFAQAGLSAGDRVILHMRNRPEFVAAYLACFKAGLVAVSINPRLKLAEIKPLLERTEPALYIGQADLYAEADRLSGTGLAVDRHVLVDSGPAWQRFLGSDLPLPAAAEFPASAPALLLPTSGTSGLPKLAVHTRGTLASMIAATTTSRTDRDSYTLLSSPVAHALACLYFLGTIAYGEAINLLDGFDAGRVLDEIAHGRAHRLATLPYMVGALAEEQLARPRNVDALQLCVTAGDTLPPQMRARFEQAFGPKLMESFGATEAAGCFTPGRGSFSLSNAAEFRLLDPDGRVIPDGKEGELSLRGPIVVVGYWESPARIRPLSPGGWFDTGDLVRQVAPGEFVYVSRIKDIIIRAGSNIAPAEIEKALLDLPAVSAAMVVGIPDQAIGQRVAAFIELKNGAANSNLRHLIGDLSKSLADYKLPEMLKIVDSLPRNNNGKLDRAAMRANVPSVWDLDLRAS